MLTTTFQGRAVREPVARTIHDEEGDSSVECDFCGADCHRPDGHKGSVFCGEECRDAAAYDAAQEARGDAEREDV
jgi:hypothetical protein